MPYGTILRDANGVPISQIYVPGIGFQALQGPPGAPDGNNNTSTGAVLVIGGVPATDPYFASVFAGGMLRVQEDPSQLFQDGFDTATLDVTNRWKTPTAGGGGVAATNALTNTVLATGTTANGYSVLESVPSFPPVNPGWLLFYTGINIAFPTIINQYFFWGLGTSPATPTAALPLTNACGFEVATDGKLYAVTYQSGTRVLVQDLSVATGNSKQPQNASVHLYYIYYRGDRIFWCIDSPDSVVAQTLTGANGPDVNVLPIKFSAIAGAVAPLSSGLLQVNTVTLADTARNNFQIADATFPWRQAVVDALGNLSIANGISNGVTIDQQRGNINTGALITASGVTVGQTSADQTNYNGRGVVVTLNTTVIGTGSVTVTIQGKDSASGAYYTLLVGGSVLTNTTNAYSVYPGITATAAVSASSVLPRTWRVITTANNANAATYTVSACVIV